MSDSIKKFNINENLTNKKIKELQEKLNITFDNLQLPENIKKIRSIIKKKLNAINPCKMALYDDTKLSIKKHQLNVANHLVNIRGSIVVHSVGTGKTLTAIATAQCLLIKKIIDSIIVITPTSLQSNFIMQAKMYGLDDEQISTFYTFYTIQGITNAIENNTVINPSNSLIIIDEAHNLRTIGGTRFNFIFKYTKKAKKILLLTATPLINYRHDIINLVSLINKKKPISIEKFNKMIDDLDETKLQNWLSNIFSFYTNSKFSNNNIFPTVKILEIYLPMDKNYYKIYSNVEKGQISKIPDFKGKNIHVFYNGLRRVSNIIDKKSPKISWIIKKIKSDPRAKFLIFSHFINMGIKPVMDWLDANNIPFSQVTGDISIKERTLAVEQYNSGNVNILFISKAGSEGLDLKNTNYIIIMESSWNENSIEQIIGRGIRYKSHIKLPVYKRKVTIYKLYSVKPDEFKNIDTITNNYLLDFDNKMLSVDLYLKNYAWLKQQEIIQFNVLLKKYKI